MQAGNVPSDADAMSKSSITKHTTHHFESYVLNFFCRGCHILFVIMSVLVVVAPEAQPSLTLSAPHPIFLSGLSLVYHARKKNEKETRDTRGHLRPPPLGRKWAPRCDHDAPHERFSLRFVWPFSSPPPADRFDMCPSSCVVSYLNLPRTHAVRPIHSCRC